MVKHLVVVCVFFLSFHHHVKSGNPYDDLLLKLNNSLKANAENPCWQSLTKLNSSQIFTLIDASANLFLPIPTGFVEKLNFYDLGHFGQCYEFQDTQDEKDVYGKYCINTIPMLTPEKSVKADHNLRMMGTNSTLIGLHYAHCMLSTCTAEDFKSLLDITGMAVYDDRFCYSKADEKKLTGGDIAAISIYSIFGFLLLCSTVYDIILYYSKKEPAHELVLAFSLLSNGRKLFKSTTNPDQLLCLNGIRALSMVWVVYGHEFSNILIFSGTNNMADINAFGTDAKNMYMLAATVSVDTFFALAGLVTVYSFIKSVEKGVKFNIIMFYVHRYLRLTPAFAMIILFNSTIIRYFGNGPFWGIVSDFSTPCQEYWWSALLYIQNYVNPNDTCVGQSWYLSVDMQLFILSPLVLIILHKWPKYGLYLLGVLTVFGVLVPFGVTYGFNLRQQLSTQTDDMSSTTDYMQYYYSQTYARFGPYVIGMLFGYLIIRYKSNKEVKEKVDGLFSNKLILCSLWIIGLVGLLACTYGGENLFTSTPTLLSASFYNGFNRNAWSVAVCVIVLLCVTGFGGPINAFLSLPVFQFLAKLSYSMYLTHFSLISIRLMSSKVLINFDPLLMTHYFWGDFMIVVIVSFFFCAAFESPFVILEKYIFGGHSKPNSKLPK